MRTVITAITAMGMDMGIGGMAVDMVDIADMIMVMDVEMIAGMCMVTVIGDKFGEGLLN